jgi:quercetin dioxygenase-like cupin family protein
MHREDAIVFDDLWSGRVRTEPGVTSAWHHHGNHDTIVYVAGGALSVETAAAVVEAEQGDFVHIPAHTVHREGNPSDRPSELIVVRRGTGPIVTNVDGP